MKCNKIEPVLKMPGRQILPGTIQTWYQLDEGRIDGEEKSSYWWNSPRQAGGDGFHEHAEKLPMELPHQTRLDQVAIDEVGKDEDHLVEMRLATDHWLNTQGSRDPAQVHGKELEVDAIGGGEVGEDQEVGDVVVDSPNDLDDMNYKLNHQNQINQQV